MDKHYEEKRALLTKNLLNMKKEGFRVFINKPDRFREYNYGIISDGTDIVYVQIPRRSTLFETSFQYVPSKKNGTGIQTIEEGYGYEKILPEVFEEVVKIGRSYACASGIRCYTGIEEYFSSRPSAKDLYQEL